MWVMPAARRPAADICPFLVLVLVLSKRLPRDNAPPSERAPGRWAPGRHSERLSERVSRDSDGTRETATALDSDIVSAQCSTAALGGQAQVPSRSGRRIRTDGAP